MLLISKCEMCTFCFLMGWFRHGILYSNSTYYQSAKFFFFFFKWTQFLKLNDIFIIWMFDSQTWRENNSIVLYLGHISRRLVSISYFIDSLLPTPQSILSSRDCEIQLCHHLFVYLTTLILFCIQISCKPWIGRGA